MRVDFYIFTQKCHKKKRRRRKLLIFKNYEFTLVKDRDKTPDRSQGILGQAWKPEDQVLDSEPKHNETNKLADMCK